MEDAIATGGTDPADMARALSTLHAAGRAYRAVGTVSEDDVDAIIALTELALFVRGNDWLTIGLTDLPTMAPVDRGALRSVTATDDALVELWDHAVVVRTTSGDDYELAGDVPLEHDWMEIRTTDGLVSVDLSTGVAARTVDAMVRPVSVADLAAIWVACAAPAAVAHADRLGGGGAGRAASAAAFEAVAVTATPDGRTITAISGSQLLHTHGGTAPSVEWIVSPAGVHLISGGLVVDPPVPPPPAPLSLTSIDGGTVTHVALR